jgi:hypothetical protein
VAEQLGLEGGWVNPPLLISYVNAIAQCWTLARTKVAIAQAKVIVRQLPLLAQVVRSYQTTHRVKRAAFIAPLAVALHIPGAAKKVAALYDAVPAESLGAAEKPLQNCDIDAVLLYSPRSARIWLALAGGGRPSRKTRGAAAGAKGKGCARPLGLLGSRSACRGRAGRTPRPAQRRAGLCALFP